MNVILVKVKKKSSWYKLQGHFRLLYESTFAVTVCGTPRMAVRVR